jgi:hypothetical protein
LETLTFCFDSTYSNGWPKLTFSIDNQICLHHQISHQKENVDLAIDTGTGTHQLCITKTSTSAGDDQLVVLGDILINGVKLPLFVKDHSNFRFNDLCHTGSSWWQPNGSWFLEFQAPLLGWVIDTIPKKNTNGNDLLQYQQRAELRKDLIDFVNELNAHV